MDFGEYFGQPEPYVKHLNSKVEYRISNCLEITRAEDLIEPLYGATFDQYFSVWELVVKGSCGYPRPILGTLVLRADHNGELYLSID